MSEIDWSRRTAIALAVTPLFVVTAGFGTYSYWLGNVSGLNEAVTQQYQIEYADQTDRRIARCFQEAASPRECVEEAIRGNYEQQRAEADLQAQRDMANWAFWVLIVSTVGLTITGIGTAFLAWQVQLTRRAVEDTENATDAMQAANEIALAIGKAQSRAYLSIDKVECKSTENGFCFKATVQNSGNSPAFSAQILIRIIHQEGDDTVIEPFEEHVVPAQSFTSFAECYGLHDADDDGQTVLIVVEIAYADVFGELAKITERFAAIKESIGVEYRAMTQGRDIASFIRARGRN